MIKAGAGQWVVRSSQMRLTVMGRTRNLRLGGEKRNSCGEELEAKKEVGDGWAEEL